MTTDLQVVGYVMVTLTSTSLVLNILVIVSLLLHIATLPPYMYLVLNLAVSDGLISVLACSVRSPGLIIPDFYQGSASGMAACRIAMLFYFPIIVSSNNTILFITLDRYCAVTRPLRHTVTSRSRRYVTKAVVLSWAVVLVVMVTHVVFYLHAGGPDQEWYDGVFGRCSFTSVKGGKPLHFVNQVTFLILPSGFTIIMYVAILRGLRRTGDLNLRLTDEPCHPQQISRKSAITITLILVLYYFSYLPSLITRDVPMIVGVPFRGIPNYLTTATSLAFHLSALSDPVIYGIRSPYIFRSVKACFRNRVLGGGNTYGRQCNAPNNVQLRDMTVIPTEVVHDRSILNDPAYVIANQDLGIRIDQASYPAQVNNPAHS